MRQRMVVIGLLVLICAAPTVQRHAQAQAGIVDLGVRLAVLQSLNVLSDARLNGSSGDTTADNMRRASDTLRFLSLVKAENLDELLAPYSSDGAVVLPSQESLNVSELRGWFRGAFDRFTVSRNTLRLDPSGIQVIGDYAVATGFVMTELSDRTGQVSQFSVSSDFKLLLVRQGGNWRVLRQSFSVPNGSWRTAN